MNRVQMDRQLLERITCGNVEAMDWLSNYWSSYVHLIDDLVDGDAKGPEALLRGFALAAELFAHPFYLRHLPELKRLVLVVTNLYADSVQWEKSEVSWQREWADHNRHAGMEMVIAVAQLCGGYAHGRAISLEQRCICYFEHHNQEGEAV